MAKMKRYNVISLRITDQEKESLEQVMLTTSKSVSAVMREALRIITGHGGNLRGTEANPNPRLTGCITTQAVQK